jgi:hypothetical protein
MAVLVCSPSFAVVLFFVATIANGHQVIMIQADVCVAQVVRCQMDLVVYFRSRFNQALAKTYLA